MSGYHELIREVNDQIREEDLQPILEVKINGEAHPLLAQIINMCERYKIDIHHVYSQESEPRGQLYFWKFPVFYPLHILDTDDSEFLDKYMDVLFYRIDAYSTKEKVIQHAIEILLVSGKGTFLVLNQLYWMLPKEERYELFRHFYIDLDYGHSMIGRNMIEDAISNRPDSYTKELEAVLDDVSSEEGTIVVYRGEGSTSTSYKKAYSWTTSFKTACFFASRYSKEGKVYKGKVKREHVVESFHERNEHELLLFAENVEEVTDLELAVTKEELNKLSVEGYFEEYHLYKNTFILEKYYNDAQGIHGIPHVRRVLIHCLNLSRVMSLPDTERAILALSACFHDIGRIHDGEDTIHGKKGWKKYLKKVTTIPMVGVHVVPLLKEQGDVEEGEYQLETMDGENYEIIRFVIEQHCVNDAEARIELDKDKTIIDKERAWRLYQVFKDADALDRVRFSPYLGDLDVTYLRTEEAKKNILFAKNIYDGMKKG